MMSEKLKIRPYARLITMLGDQLIKNETIALTELIKNSYDADASWVKISFENFGDDYSLTPSSKIIIEDDGCGMNEEILKKHWVNPATPDKLNRKKESNKTPKGRILQGEKGIGRFAIFKLGKKITITTRRQKMNEKREFIDAGEDTENILTFDFAKYDNDFLLENGEKKDLFLEQLDVDLVEQSPKTIVEKKVDIGLASVLRKPYGTVIEISELKTCWTENKIERIQKQIGKLQPIFSGTELGFSIQFYKDNSYLPVSEGYKDEIKNLLDKKSVIRITEGQFISAERTFRFKQNGEDKELRLDDEKSEIRGLKHMKKITELEERNEKLECGDFSFEFYFFDFSANAEFNKFNLSKSEKEIIKEHRVYLYRDGVRVMPYGDPEDDWLGIDISRGTERASDFLSNDQVVGCVYISQENNPHLRDKTNREGLIEEGHALEDFVNVLRLLLSYIRSFPFAIYQSENAKKRENKILNSARPEALFEKAIKHFQNDGETIKYFQEIEKSYQQEKRILTERITKTENLAAVGLSIETASHDVMLLLHKTIDQVASLYLDAMKGSLLNSEMLTDGLSSVRGNLAMIESQMKDIQILFPSTKAKTKNIEVNQIIEKVEKLYSRSFLENNIVVKYDRTTQPLFARTTDAVLFQVFINLFDNSLYWLKTVDRERKILITIDGNQGRIVFSDNGPGISANLETYIFDAFISGKGEDGRGLGLYIAKQLLDRYDYDIRVAEFSSERKLCGANFVIEFVKGD